MEHALLSAVVDVVFSVKLRPTPFVLAFFFLCVSTPIASAVAPQAYKGNCLLVLLLWTGPQSYLVVRVYTVYYFCGGVFLSWCGAKLVEICPLSWGE